MPSFTANALRFFSPVFEGPWVSERAEAKDQSNILWAALLASRMLAQGLIRGNAWEDENATAFRTRKTRIEWKVELAAEKNCQD